MAQSARAVADRLSDLVDVGGSTRRPLALPGGVARDSLRATEHLLRAPGALVVIDGYNVAKLGWPDGALADQRELALDVIDDAARRFGSDVTVVFDGADVVGAHAARRRLARVVYSPAGIAADDVIRSIVAGDASRASRRRRHQRPGRAALRGGGRCQPHLERRLPGLGPPLKRSNCP